MSKQVTFGINYRLQSYDKVNFDETVYLGKIAGSSFFLKEVPDSVILTRDELKELIDRAWAAALNHERYGFMRPDQEEYLSSLIKQ